MGGEIGAGRSREGGSRFWFELDLPPAEAPPRRDEAATLGLPRLRALAVDLEQAARTGNAELDTLSALMPATIEASHRHIDAYWSSLRDDASMSSM